MGNAMGNVDGLTQVSSDREVMTGDPYVRFQIDKHLAALLPMSSVLEVLRIPVKSVIAVPNMPSCVLGTIGRRNRVYWLADLPQTMGLPALEPSNQFSILIVNASQLPLAVAVAEVEGVSRFALERFTLPDQATPKSLRPYTKGLIREEEALFYLLDAEAIVRSPLLRS